MAKNPSVTIYWAAKAGNSDQEYEDAGCMASEFGNQGAVSHYAVADGASETSFAGRWARSLVKAYCQGLLTGSKGESTLKVAREQWINEISQMSLPWFAEDKARQGAFATLCGLTVGQDLANDVDGGQWKALAIGDSCLFQVRDESVIRSFPLEKSADFGSSPEMLSSLADKPSAAELLSAEGHWLTGDIFLVMTDALALRFLSEAESGQLPSNFLTHLDSEQTFLGYLEESRRVVDDEGIRQLRNDDVTVLMIRM